MRKIYACAVYNIFGPKFKKFTTDKDKLWKNFKRNNDRNVASLTTTISILARIAKHIITIITHLKY